MDGSEDDDMLLGEILRAHAPVQLARNPRLSALFEPRPKPNAQVPRSDAENCQPANGAADNFAQGGVKRGKPLVGDASVAREEASREQRRRKRDNVVIDPCQDAERRRLLKQVLPRLKADATISVAVEKAPGPLAHPVTSGNTLDLGSHLVVVERMLGQGTFGEVYAARVIKAVAERGHPMVAVKVCKPAQLWECYIQSELRARLSLRARERVILAMAAHVYVGSPLSEASAGELIGRGASTLVLPLAGSSLEKLLACHRSRGARLGESAAAFLVADMLRAVDGLHSAGVLHADLRPDNIALRGLSSLEEAMELDPRVRLDRTDGAWRRCGVALLDFGRAIDTTLYEEGTVFSGDVLAHGYECPEMRRGASWTHQIDFFALAATIHAVLHSDADQPMRIQRDRKGRWQPIAPRLLDGGCEAPSLWEGIFDKLLNANPQGSAAGVSLGSLAEDLHDYVDTSPSSRVELRAELVRLCELLRDAQQVPSPEPRSHDRHSQQQQQHSHRCRRS